MPSKTKRPTTSLNRERRVVITTAQRQMLEIFNNSILALHGEGILTQTQWQTCQGYYNRALLGQGIAPAATGATVLQMPRAVGQ
jgi:hypothetical protein